jgi:pilus assembly protein FimV
MNRSLKLSILLGLTLSATQALALGLGRIHVKSALGKPLVAEIPLRTDYPGEADKLDVSLASADQFARAGLDRMDLTVQLKFKVATNAAGQKVIQITSDQPVRATFLDFLIKVSWPRGQLLREYTVLLNPPGTVASTQMQDTVAPAKTPPARTRRQAPAQHPAAAPKQHRAPEENKPAAAKKPVARKAPAPKKVPAPAPSSQAGNYGPVRHGQTLWGIARANRESGVSVNQMMIALKAANPQAFYKNNINALKSGAVLRIPSRDRLLAKTTAEVTAEVRRQNRSWNAAAPSRPTMVASAGRHASAAPAKPGAASARGGEAASTSGDHLKLVPPKQGGETTGARAGVAGGSNKVSVDELHQDLSRAKEALSSAKQQTADMQAHLKSLKDIQDKNDRLMSLKNAEIAELQNKLAAAGKPVPGASSAMPAMAGSVASGASAGMPATAASASAALATAGTAVQPAAASSVHAGTAAAAKDKQTKPPVQHPPASEPWYGPLWTKIVIAVGIIVLLILFLLGRRRRAKPAPAAASGPSLADHFGDSPLGGSPDEPAQDEEQADLLHELAENPDDVGLHLELVSLYYARRDVERFESAAEAMHTHVDDPQGDEWQDVLAMGEELSPDYPLFAFSEGPAAAGDADTASDASDATPSWSSEMDEPAAGDEHADDGAREDRGHADEDEATILEQSYDFDLGSAAETQSPEAPSEDEFDALPPIPDETDANDQAGAAKPEALIEPEDDDSESAQPAHEIEIEDESESEPQAEHDADATSELSEEEPHDEAQGGAGFGGDAVDTKLDLARAYMDMGDPDGARAMLEEVLTEGSQSQRDVAQKLLDEID